MPKSKYIHEGQNTLLTAEEQLADTYDFGKAPLKSPLSTQAQELLYAYEACDWRPYPRHGL